MKKLLFLITLLLFLNIKGFSQSYQQCQCSTSSSDKTERLIALAAKGSLEAIDFYDSAIIKLSTPIDEDLIKCVNVLKYSQWFEVENLRIRMEYLLDYYLTKDNKKWWGKDWKKKTKKRNDANFWIKTNRIYCFEQIVKEIESIDEYKKWKSSNKKGKKEIERLQIKKAVDKARADPQPVIKKEKEHDTIYLPVYENKTEHKKRIDSTGRSGNVTSKIVASGTIFFREGEIVLDDRNISSLNKLKPLIKDSTVSEIDIEGFASNTGSREANLAISMSRCYQVKNWLQKNGYSGKFNIYSVGETERKDFRAVIITIKANYYK